MDSETAGTAVVWESAVIVLEWALSHVHTVEEAEAARPVMEPKVNTGILWEIKNGCGAHGAVAVENVRDAMGKGKQTVDGVVGAANVLIVMEMLYVNFQN